MLEVISFSEDNVYSNSFSKLSSRNLGAVLKVKAKGTFFKSYKKTGKINTQISTIRQHQRD